MGLTEDGIEEAKKYSAIGQRMLAGAIERAPVILALVAVFVLIMCGQYYMYRDFMAQSRETTKEVLGVVKENTRTQTQLIGVIERMSGHKITTSDKD